MSAAAILDWGLGLAQGALVLAMALAAWRMLRGPRAHDRILGLDTLYLNGMLAIVVHGMRTGSGLYFEAALIIGHPSARIPELLNYPGRAWMVHRDDLALF